MGKQKIVLKVQMEDAKKRTKALKVAVGLEGVISAQIDGEKIVVIGEDIDSVVLTVMLRKRMGFAELISVESADKKKEEEKKKKEEEEKKKKEEEDKKTAQMMVWPYQYSMVPSQPLIYESRDPYNDSCSIM